MMIRTLIAAAAMACLAVPAIAAPAMLMADPPATTVTPVAVDGVKKDKDDEKSRVVCKRVNPTGSRTPGKKICRTSGEWAADEADAKAGLEDVSRRSLQSAPRM